MSLKLTKLSKSFTASDKNAFAAVSDLTLDFEKGRFYTLLGPSGCGKTTLLRMIAGFEYPTSGEIFFKGVRINEMPAHKRGFPMVFQSYALFPHMTVQENVAYGLKVKKISKAEIKERVQKILALLELQDHSTKYPHQMSGGQQQRVALARALVLEPEIILFDEPLSNLDARLRVSMREEIRALQKRLAITAIYVTHDQEEAMAISDQIIVLNQGRIEQQGSPQDIYRKPASEFVARFLGAANVLPVKFQLFDKDFLDAKPSSRFVVVRPEAIKLSKGQGKHKALVENSTFLGSRVQYTLNYEGMKIALDTTWSGQEPLFASGEEVTFELDPKELHFI